MCAAHFFIHLLAQPKNSRLPGVSEGNRLGVAQNGLILSEDGLSALCRPPIGRARVHCSLCSRGLRPVATNMSPRKAGLNACCGKAAGNLKFVLGIAAVWRKLFLRYLIHLRNGIKGQIYQGGINAAGQGLAGIVIHRTANSDARLELAAIQK